MRSARQHTSAKQRWNPRTWSGDDLAPIESPALGLDPDADLRHAILARTIEGEIIPRLMLAHAASSDAAAERADAPPDPDAAAEYARLTLLDDASVAAAYIAALRARGQSVESILLYVLTPAARHLGDLWVADLCDFADVTVGLGRMQQALRELLPAFERAGGEETRRRILLAPVPGDQHSFGVFMVEGFFRRAGWDVRGGLLESPQDAVRRVGEESYDIVGLSASCDLSTDDLGSAIDDLRVGSRNRAVGVMVGGRFFLDNPDCVSRVGADATAADGRQAAQRIIALLALKT